ncbi:hypothetical protein HYH03_012688 [Edaphochlamys debaryana]|uniref:Pherophorin domain-containing protein n=1 Tax=Edaphochlamys debaryana TaxID=47281 RepID=A0A835XPH0_9CHLO|nr:hypothetical protein HYH03_012688 [Edaphochlamys debaryana]|eukprot:KAG2488687.1 hypothetical protein HYH03_012688 [Edaphochlamys debaryana]
MRRAVIAVALLAFVAAASAQDEGRTIFPYSTCDKLQRDSVYSVSAATGTGPKICWTIQSTASQCNPAKPEDRFCCGADLHKFELDVKPSCANNFEAWGYLTAPGSDEAVKVGRAYIRAPPNSEPGEATLYVAGLELTPGTADGYEFCLKITKGMCNSLTKLSPGGELWQVALVDTTHACCPVTKYAPPPPPPSPPAPCDACLVWSVDHQDEDIVVPFFDSEERCDTAKAAISALLAPFQSATSGIIAITTPPTCSGNTVRVCVRLWSVEEGDRVSRALDNQNTLLVVFGVDDSNDCPANLDGLLLNLITTDENGVRDDECLDIFQGFECPMLAPPFPYCECVRKRFVTPFGVSPVVTNPKPRKYCVAVHTMPVLNGRCNGKDNSADTIDKIEFWFDYKLRYDLDYITIETTTAGVKTITPKAAIWGVPKENTLKVSQLGWSEADVEEKDPQICFTLKRGASFDDLALGANVWSSVFDPEQVCCPTYFGSVY